MPRPYNRKQLVLSKEAQDWAQANGWDAAVDGAHRLLVAYRTAKRARPSRRPPAIPPELLREVADQLKGLTEKVAALEGLAADEDSSVGKA